MLRILTLTLILHATQLLVAQSIISKGVPYIKSFKNQQDKLYSHTWSIDEASNGITYFVNDKGLLEFDGTLWKLYKGSKGITRSIKVVNDKLIYTGSDNDFGLWKQNTSNEFKYTSLYEKIRNKSQVEEFWDVFKLGKAVVFRSFYNLYIYRDGNYTIIKSPSRFITATQTNNTIWLIDEKEGLMSYDGFQLKTIPIDRNIEFSNITAIDANKNEIRLISRNHGIYSLKDKQFLSYNSIANFPKNDIIFCHQRISDEYYALGTIQNGVLILNNAGEIIHKINKTKGLQNNTILSMHFSSNGYLWLGLDFGIDAVHLNTPISYIIDYQGDIGTTYAAYNKDNNLLLGTNQGLYSTAFTALNNNRDKIAYRLVPNSQGQVWTIQKTEKSILVGHDKGLFKIKNNALEQIDNKKGVLAIMSYGDYILTGNYEGLYAYKKDGTQISFVKKVPKLVGNFKKLLRYKNKLFAQMSNIGVLEFELDSQLNVKRRVLYNHSVFNNKPFQVSLKGEQLLVYTFDSVYRLSLEKSQTSFQSKKYNQNIILKNHLLQDNFLPILNHPDYQIYSIYNGFSIKGVSSSKREVSQKISKPLIRNVMSYNNFDKEQLKAEGKVEYEMNNVLIQYILPSLEEDIQYQYSLEPAVDWTNWTHKTSQEFFNLKEGDYTFKLRARYIDKTSETSSFEFTVKPPFYRSWWAYLIYIGLTFLSFYSMRLYGKQKLKKQKIELQRIQKASLEEQSRKYQEKLDIERREKLELEQAQLKKTLENKELELAKKTIDQMEINEMILSIRKKLEKVQSNATEKLSTIGYNDLIQFINKKINNELAMEYEIAFDSSQTKFHESLLKAHPGLSSKDLRICSYILMNLSSKEIAKIINVLPSSIDVGRSRLRKKLNLRVQDNLRDYLSQFTG